MRPFENDHESLSISGLSVDNGTEMIAIHGMLEIARDRRSLQRIEALEQLFADIKAELMRSENLPDVATPDIEVSKVDVVANPFGDN